MKTYDQIVKEFTEFTSKFEKKKDKKMYMKRGATAIVLNHDNNIVDKDLEIFKKQKKLLEYIIVYLINFQWKRAKNEYLLEKESKRLNIE